MEKIVINVQTGERETLPFTQEEMDALNSMPRPDPQIEVDAKLAKVRAVREAILGRVLGIKDAARDAGDVELVAVCSAIRIALLDITTGHPTDPAAVDAFILEKYIAIRAALPDTLTKAFAGVDA